MEHCEASRAAGGPVPTGDSILEGVAKTTQDFTPVSNVCAWLNAFHVYNEDPTRIVEAQHYCSRITEDIRQCILYDSPSKDARLIGIEYMITPKLYETLPAEERALWHSHVFEVKAGVLVMPKPALIPEELWDKIELVEMEEVVNLYGKTYQLWQVDRGDLVPMGEPKLMSSFLHETAGVGRVVCERNKRFGIDRERKMESRKHIEEPDIHSDADQWDQSKHP